MALSFPSSMVRFLVALLAVAALAVSKPTSRPSNIVPGAFIIEISPSTLLTRANHPFVDSPLVVTLGNIARTGLQYKVRQSFTDQPILFHGASIDVAPSTSISDLLAIPGISRAWPVRRRQRPISPRTSDGGTTGAAGAPVTAAALLAGANPPPDTSSNATARFAKRAAADYSVDTFAPHVATGVDKTHKANQLGSGVLVCILDTGIDYNNPILGGCFGSGCHVSVGYDLVGDAYDGTNTPVPDADPYSACNSHGTHVAGIIGALANGYGFSGVAPQASLGMFRIFGCTGSVTDDVELQAYLKAMQAGCKVINMSLGGPGGYESAGPVERLIETAAAQGIFTAVSAGNEGAEGLFFASDPASNRGGASIAAVNSLELPALTATVFGYPSLPYLGVTRFNATRAGHRVFFTSTDPNVVGDACSPLPASTPNLANYVVVVQRGGCNFVVKYQNVFDKGGKLLIVYNNAAATGQVYVGFTFGNPGLDAVTSMRREDGLALLNDYTSSGGRLVMKFPDAAIAPNVLDTLTGGLVADFSSYATTFDMYGVNFGAPGGNILSTFPLQDGGIGVDSGTSMSSPFVAGAAAVIMAARQSEGLTVPQIKSLLSTTTSLVRTTKSDSSDYTTVALQGAGMIQVDLAIAAKTFVNPIQLAINDSSHLATSQVISVTNKGPGSMIYTLSAVLGQGVGLYDDFRGVTIPSTEPPAVPAAQASVSFSAIRIVVGPGATVPVTVTVSPPQLSAADALLYPTYSGWVVLTGTEGKGATRRESLRVPYFGLSGSLFNVPVLDITDNVYGTGYAYPFLYNGDIQLQAATYTFPNGPVLYSRMAMGSQKVTIDLVSASIAFTGTIPTNNNAPGTTKRSPARVLYSDVPTLGVVSEADLIPRDALVSGTGDVTYTDSEIQFQGVSFVNGVAVQAVKGVSYRLLLRALKITGDPMYEDQYESWLSPPFSYSL